MTRHEDDRRILIEWIENVPIKSCKVVIAKVDTMVGNHRHLLKDEHFYLLSGQGQYRLDNDDWKPMTDVIYVPRGTKHSFLLNKGAIMLSAASEPFNKDDEIKS